MKELKAVVVSACNDTLEMLQRRVGGILKGIAKVEKVFQEEVAEDGSDLLICLAHGENLEILKEKFKYSPKPVIGVELTLLPAAVRRVSMIEENCTLGVISRHQRCANYFCSEIIRSATTGHKFITGTFEDMASMPVNKFLLPEELVNTVDKNAFQQEIIYLPRSISSDSAAEIIEIALKLSK